MLADSDNEYTNDEMVTSAVSSNFTIVYLFTLILLVTLILFAICGYISVTYTMFTFIMALAVSIYSVLYISTVIWAKLYSKKKDMILKRKKEKLENKVRAIR
jgi:preprotein translocase subunit SecF